MFKAISAVLVCALATSCAQASQVRVNPNIKHFETAPQLTARDLDKIIEAKRDNPFRYAKFTGKWHSVRGQIVAFRQRSVYISVGRRSHIIECDHTLTGGKYGTDPAYLNAGDTVTIAGDFKYIYNDSKVRDDVFKFIHCAVK